MSKTKKQHYVPQFYLRAFSNSKSQIKVYDKFNQKSFQANIKDIASANYFYDLSQELIKEIELSLQKKATEGKENQKLIDDLNQVQIIEKRLSNLEGRFANVFNKSLKSLESRKRFKEKYRNDLSLFLAVQFWRTNNQRQSMMELGQKIENGVMEIVNKMNKVKGTNFTAKDLGIAYDQTETADAHRMLLLDNDNLNETATIFNNHIWIIGVNDTNDPFYTSDNPFNINPHKTDDWRTNSGIASPGIEITFPLSPKYVLTMIDRGHFSTMEQYDGKIMYHKKENVMYQNSRQVYSSHRQIYSSAKNFELVDLMIEKDDRLKLPQARWR